MNIFVVGYPFIERSHLDTFNFYLGKDRIFFLLPKRWTAKGGKVVSYPPEEKNIFTTPAIFRHSGYPLIGGSLKGWMPLFPLALLRLRLKNRVDLIFNCNEPILLASLYNSFWIKFFGLKNILFSWENVPYETKFAGLGWIIQKIILKLNLFFCDGMVCGNKKCKEIFEKRMSKPISVIPLRGLDGEFLKPLEETTQKEFNSINLKGKIVFTFAGAIGFRKGIHLIIKVLPLVLEQIPNSVLIIAGSGEYEQEINQLINELNLKKNIIRIPWLNQFQLRNLFSISDVFLYPSLSYGGWEEQFGYSMAEASLMELPVISTTSGSIEEVVINGKTGILVKPGDKDGLKDAMVRLGKDENLRKNLGTAGREYIIENFSYQKIVQRFFSFFRKFQ